MSQSLVQTLQPKIDAAFLAASRKVIERARRAGHGIATSQDGHVVEISCDDAERLLAQAEERARTGNG